MMKRKILAAVIPALLVAGAANAAWLLILLVTSWYHV